MAIATKVLYFVGCFGFVAMLVLSWVGSFLDRHLLGFTFPSIGGETLSLSLDCDTDFEALVIAAQAYPFLYSEGDFGLAEAVVSIRLDSCLARPIVEMSRDYLMDLDTWSEKNQNLAIPGRPSRLTHYRLSDPLPVGFYPAWYTGKLTYLVKNYASLNTGHPSSTLRDGFDLD